MRLLLFLSFSFQIFINNELLAVMNNKIYPGYWFARDVTAAMLMVRDNSISLLEELNSIFVEILRKQFFLFTTNIAALSRGCKPRIEPIVWCAACLIPSPHYCARPMRFGSRDRSESRPAIRL